jgi:REP element-mobilizing transposase RayT
MYDSEIHHRRSIRAKGYDYSQDGAYFATVCAQNRQCLFGSIANAKMELNEAGEIVNNCWYEIPKHYPFVVLDEFVVMPNHFHGIIVIQNREWKRERANNHSPAFVFLWTNLIWNVILKQQ